VSDLVYTYTPDDTNNLSGQMKMVIHLVNTEIDTIVTLCLELEVDNSQSVQTNYIFDSVIYTALTDDVINNIEGYSNMEFFPNFANYMGGIKEGNIGIWEGKFRFNEDGYKYILYRGGRGPSRLFAKINDETEYKEIGYILINQGAYMFEKPSYAYYEHEGGFKKGDVVKFKAYLLGKTLATGASASMYIGISKVNDVSKVKTLSSSEIVGVDSEFDVKYTFHSGDPYFSEKQFDSLSFFDYSLVKVSSPNFQPWDASFSLDKLIDRSTTTYIHTKRNTRINENNPLTLIFDLGREYYYNYIYFVKRGPNNYAPKKLTISISNDNVTWTEIETLETEVGNEIVEINLSEKLHSRYVKLHITETTSPSPGYIALVSVEFIEKGVNYALTLPEMVNITYTTGAEVEINYKNFPYFGHSYILKPGSTMQFLILNTTGIRIKTCHKADAKIKATVKKGDDIVKNEEIINVEASNTGDFQITITNLERADYDFILDVVEGSFDLEYILYEN
jgi:hypothetical protein